ncbi:MAG: SDR family oxidoreductase [Gammaproteobacteria bacterium]|nr:SDR family oxidoreductase [Gammaproteobacteria bacterium]
MLNGKTALITGAMGGIGEAIARALGGQGCNLMLNDIGATAGHEARCAELADTLGVTVLFDGADLSRRDQIEALVRSTENRLGPVDILVNNAVKRHYHEISEFPPEEWDYALQVNVTAPFDLCRLVLAGMKQRGFGRIVNMSSLMGLGAKAGRADYITSKTAIIGLTRAVAAETLSDPDITCNAICPGSVLTPFISTRIQGLADERGIGWDEMAARYRANINQIADFIKPEQIASMIAYLCSDAARGITGTSIPIDAGVSGSFLQGPEM